MRIRDFRPSDTEACLEVFRSNLPRYFHEREQREFRTFLEDLPGPYLVVEEGDALVACGGFATDAVAGRADLCWGMVHRAMHGRGFGTALVRERIRRAARTPGVEVMRMNTSQHTVRFYERFGFEVTAHLPDGFGPGLDRYDMRRVLAGRRP